MFHNLLHDLGFQVGELVSGRPQIRGNSGFPFRWGERWFFEFRAGGPGWFFQRDDKAAVAFRVKLLLDMFIPKRSDGLLAIADSLLAIADRAS